MDFRGLCDRYMDFNIGSKPYLHSTDQQSNDYEAKVVRRGR